MGLLTRCNFPCLMSYLKLSETALYRLLFPKLLEQCSQGEFLSIWWEYVWMLQNRLLDVFLVWGHIMWNQIFLGFLEIECSLYYETYFNFQNLKLPLKKPLKRLKWDWPHLHLNNACLSDVQQLSMSAYPSEESHGYKQALFLTTSLIIFVWYEQYQSNCTECTKTLSHYLCALN